MIVDHLREPALKKREDREGSMSLRECIRSCYGWWENSSVSDDDSGSLNSESDDSDSESNDSNE